MLHHDEVLVLALVEAEVEHLHDVRVHQPGGGQRLAAEARDERRVVGQVLGQQLDRDVALEPLVERQVDRRHPADAEAALDPVAPGDRLSRLVTRYRRVPLPVPLPAPVPPAVAAAPRSWSFPAEPTPPVVVDVRTRVGRCGCGRRWSWCVEVGRARRRGGRAWSRCVDVVVRGGRGAGRVVGGGRRGVLVWQSLAASWAIVLAPWLRLPRSVGLTVDRQGLDVAVQDGAGVDGRAAVARPGRPWRPGRADCSGRSTDRLRAGRSRRRRRRRTRRRSQARRRGVARGA